VGVAHFDLQEKDSKSARCAGWRLDHGEGETIREKEGWYAQILRALKGERKVSIKRLALNGFILHLKYWWQKWGRSVISPLCTKET